MTVLWDCVTCPVLTMQYCCAVYTARTLLIFLIKNNFILKKLTINFTGFISFTVAVQTLFKLNL